MTIPFSWFLMGIGLVWLVGVATGVLGRKSVTMSLALALLGSILTVVFSAGVWLSPRDFATEWTIAFNFWDGLDTTLPPLQLIFGLDALSAFFLFLISAFSTLVAIYSFRALEAEHYLPYRHWIAATFNLFCWTTALVVLARDGFTLILTLELMTLSFGYLVLYKHYRAQDAPERFDEHEQYRYRIAPQVYLIISHTSTVFILLAVLLLSIRAGGIAFADWSQVQENWKDAPLAIVFLLALIGLGIRAGLTPAHVWVSLVHPSSPTTTHALSLGIAIKVAIYLMYRFFFEFLPPQAWWGYLLLAIAVITAFINVWYAISSHDLKEALAYHSIENIGIICAGIGLGLIFWDEVRWLAYLGLLASLYHLLNHAVFKGLLYLATGAIDNLTHQNVNIDQLGGLIHRYSFTASMFLIGSFAIAGFPPLNGFISEWLTLKTGLEGLLHLENSHNILPFAALLFGLLLLVASFALTAFCFYKIAGVALLGLPRLPESARQEWENDDVPASMKVVMGVMALLCLALGVFPAFIAPQLLRALRPLGVPEDAVSWSLVSLAPATTSFVDPRLPSLVSRLLGVSLALGFLVFIARFFFPSVRRVSMPWNCGEPLSEPPFHQFSSAGLSYSFRRLFAFVNPRVDQHPDYLPMRLHLSSSDAFHQEVVEVFRMAYNRLIEWLLNLSDRFALWLQNGDIRRYMTYVFLVNLLLVILYWITSSFIK